MSEFGLVFPRTSHTTPWDGDHRERRWRVEYTNMAYEGGGGSTWDQWYRTKFGALFSRFTHMHLRSYGGDAKLYDQAIQPRCRHIVYWLKEGTGCWCGWRNEHPGMKASKRAYRLWRERNDAHEDEPRLPSFQRN